MRSIRRAAIAGATAAALLVGAASAATAEDSTPAGDTQTQGTAQKSEKKDASSDKTKSGSSDKKDGEKKDSKSSSAGSSYEEKLATEVDRETFDKTETALYMLATGKMHPKTQEAWAKEIAKITADLAGEKEFQEATPAEQKKMVTAKLKTVIADYLEDLKGNPGLFVKGKIKTKKEGGKDPNDPKDDGYEYLATPSKSDYGSALAGVKLEADKPAQGRAVFGSDRSDFDNLPKWAKALKIVTIIGAIASTLGLVVFPAYNFLLANGYIR